MKTRPTSKLTIFFSPTLPHTHTHSTKTTTTTIKNREIKSTHQHTTQGKFKKQQSKPWEIKPILHKNMEGNKKNTYTKKTTSNLASILVSKRQMSKALALPFNLPLVAKNYRGNSACLYGWSPNC